MWLTKKRILTCIVAITVISISYLSYILIPTTLGKEMSKYIDTSEIVKITFLIDEARKDDFPYHIPDKKSITYLHDYFYDINVTHAASIPYFEETDNFLFYVYDKDGNIVSITSHDGYNGLYLYVQSKKWYKAKNYNSSDEIINDIKKYLRR